MNFYGSERHMKLLREMEEQVFSRFDLSEPPKEKPLRDGYTVKYRCAVGVAKNELYAPSAGIIGLLCRDEEVLFEWRGADGHLLTAELIDHADGDRYFLFNEDLYGYSVLNLRTMECARYIPAESHAEGDAFRETFIWVEPHYDADSSLLAVEGCFWGAPYSVIVLDFSEPLRPVEADNWLNLWEDRDDCCELSFAEWSGDALRCTAEIYVEGEASPRFDPVSVSKRDLRERLNGG